MLTFSELAPRERPIAIIVAAAVVLTKIHSVVDRTAGFVDDVVVVYNTAVAAAIAVVVYVDLSNQRIEQCSQRIQKGVWIYQPRVTYVFYNLLLLLLQFL